MILECDVYSDFRKAQAESKNRPYKLPKDWESHFNNRMSKKNREALVLATKYFNTKWDKIDVFRFMQCGFELLKTFSYTQFFDQRIINLYIHKDKHIKRDAKLTKEGVVDSLKFVKTYMKDNGTISISRYCMIEKNGTRLAVRHYIDNKINKYFIVWLISMGMLHLTDDERAQMPYIIEQYRNILAKLKGSEKFLNKLKEML